ncbi:hypothetical protein BKA70DRAFT_1430032 [Coprinopsis sp. MPI-PUGE-AT-0042]|nr:hypothetical protein BKA70DRAFT_1430032 [Coprinopsis sp. MPI-PUGE-AT-0042]
MTGNESQLAASSERYLWYFTRTARTDTSKQLDAKRRRIAVVRRDLAESESEEPPYGLARHPTKSCDDTLRFALTMTQSTRPPSPNDGRQDAGIPTQYMARIMRLVPKNGCIRFRCRQVSTAVLVLAQPTNDSQQAFFDLLRNTAPSFMLNSVDLRLERVAGVSGTRRTRPTVLANNTESATRRVPSSQLPVVSMCRVLEEQGGRRDYVVQCYQSGVARCRFDGAVFIAISGRQVPVCYATMLSKFQAHRHPYSDVVAISIFSRLDMRPMRCFTEP